MRLKVWVAVGAIALLVAANVALGQEAASSSGPLRLLLVDETKTFSSTMRVGALAGVLKRSGLVEVTPLLVEVGSSYDDPLVGKEGDLAGPYDVVVVIPRGIDDGTADWIWVLANTPRGTSPDYPRFLEGIQTLCMVVERVFEGLAHAIDGRQDLFPAFLAALYVQEGILR